MKGWRVNLKKKKTIISCEKAKKGRERGEVSCCSLQKICSRQYFSPREGVAHLRDAVVLVLHKGRMVTVNKKTLWSLFMDVVQLPQGYSHFEEIVYFLPLSSQKFLVLILSTSEG